MARPVNLDRNAINPYTVRARTQARGRLIKGKPTVLVRFPPKLFAKIRAEAVKREIGVSGFVVHLCYASIDGIE